MYEQQLNILKEKVAVLAEKAKLEKIPTLKTSTKVTRAEVSFFGKSITFGTKLLEQWKTGEINENDIEATLAHEIGHLMDFQKKICSTYIIYNMGLVLYFISGIFLMVLFSLLVEFSSIFFGIAVVWLLPLPWISRRVCFAIQLEADKNGASLIGYEKFASIISNRKHSCLKKNFGLLETWKLLFNVLTVPSLIERLQNLDFEIKETIVQKKETTKTDK